MHLLASVTSGGHHDPFFIGVVVVIALVVGAVIVSGFAVGDTSGPGADH